MDRNAILDALLAYLAQAAGWRQFGRVVPFWADVPAAQQPALFLRSIGESTPGRGTGMPSKTTLHAEIWIYAKVDERVGPGATASGASGQQLESLVGAVQMALLRTGPRPALTLSGMVAHAWIEGETMKDTDNPDLQAIARIPIRILVP